MESFQIHFVYCLNYAEISLSMRNILFLNVSKNKIKSGGFYCFHADDAQNNFLGFLSLIILLEQTFFFFFLKKSKRKTINL